MQKLQKHTIHYIMNKNRHFFTQSLLCAMATILFTQQACADNLFTLFQKAKLYSPHLPLAEAQKEIAKQKLNQARASKEAKINFSAQEKMGQNKRPGQSEIDYRVRNYAIQFSIPVYNKIQDETISTAKIGEEISLEQFQVSYNELLQNIVDQYFKILSLKSKLELIQQQKVLVLEQKQMAIANFNQGMVSITDLKEAEAKFSTLQSQEQSTNFEIYKELSILAEFIGTDDVAFTKNKIPVETLPPLSYGDQSLYNQFLLTNNHQIRISELNLKVSQNEIKQSKAEKYPVLNFSAKMSRNFDSQDSAFTNKQNGLDYLYGLELNIPMYNSENYFKIKEQKASLEKNKNELLLTTQKQKAQMLDNFYSSLSAIAKTKGMLDAESSSQKAWIANKRAYEVGMRVNAEVLEAQAKYFEARQERVSAWYEAWQNYLKLKITTGTLIEQEIFDLDQIFHPTLTLQN
ncbi:TolC family protein [Acinetobacter higginsii]|uniref:TolC family protein n=1 Tax=Acinetobacter higginsii TaxID=70347 RepID=UPI0032083D3B